MSLGSGFQRRRVCASSIVAAFVLRPVGFQRLREGCGPFSLPGEVVLGSFMAPRVLWRRWLLSAGPGPSHEPCAPVSAFPATPSHSGCISQALAYALAQCLACRLAGLAGHPSDLGKSVQRSGQKHNYAFKRTAGRGFGVF
jgi:hypothetical protein